MATATLTAKDYDTGLRPIWCPGCGDFGVLAALRKALSNLGLRREEVAIVSGIGCSGAISAYVNVPGFHGIHGRVLPVAMGIKLANARLTVLGMGGDGDGYSIGLSHTVHAIRRNIDVTYVVMNNEIYGLTKGQTSPTSDEGFKTKTTPQGSIESPINPVALAIAAGGTFVARGFSGDQSHLIELFQRGIQHKGFALIDIFSPCVTFNHVNTYDWFRERLYRLEDDSAYDASDRTAAFARALAEDRIGYGVYYQDRERPSYDERALHPGRGPVVREPLTGLDFRPLLKPYYV